MLQRAGAWRREKGGDAAYVSVVSQVHAASTSLWFLRAPRCAVGAGGGAARRRRALAGALRYDRVRVEGARGERGGGLSVPQQPRARPPDGPMGALGGVTCSPPPPPKRRPEPRAPPGQQPPQPPPLG